MNRLVLLGEWGGEVHGASTTYDVMYFSIHFTIPMNQKYAAPYRITSHRTKCIRTIYVDMNTIWKDLGYSGPYKMQWLEIMQNGGI